MVTLELELSKHYKTYVLHKRVLSIFLTLLTTLKRRLKSSLTSIFWISNMLGSIPWLTLQLPPSALNTLPKSLSFQVIQQPTWISPQSQQKQVKQKTRQKSLNSSRKSKSLRQKKQMRRKMQEISLGSSTRKKLTSRSGIHRSSPSLNSLSIMKFQGATS